MPYRYPGGKRAISRNFNSSSLNVRKGGSLVNDYSTQQTTLRRHSFIDDTPLEGNINGLATGLYAVIELARFRRSFGAGADDPPTPDDSNNYKNNDVMNGSRIENYNTLITLKNQNVSRGATFDVFECALSFWDVLVWETVFDASCPFNFITTATNEGEIQTKTPTTALVDYEDWLSFKFLQHYMKYRGALTIGPTGSASNQANIVINEVPPQCRRSQTGMWWGLILKNTSEKNEGTSIACDYSKETNFDEIPSEVRLPYVN